MFLDKNPSLTTVVCKIGQIQAEYRFYDLECIAGEEGNYETVHVEDGVRFKVDVSKVYWCSKLATERNRIIKEYLKDNQLLCDMMCGIGPLAVKAASKVTKLRVVCNDLNPEGFKYCTENIKKNKVTQRVIAHNMDGREFVRMVVKQSTLPAEERTLPDEFLRFDHCYMNLPAIAVEFLDVFIGLFKHANPDVWFENPSDPKTLKLPMIHVYGFTQEKERDDALAYFVDRIGKAMKFPFKKELVDNFHNIRDVSSTSHMYSTSFRLPYEVAMDELDQGIIAK